MSSLSTPMASTSPVTGLPLRHSISSTSRELSVRSSMTMVLSPASSMSMVLSPVSALSPSITPSNVQTLAPKQLPLIASNISPTLKTAAPSINKEELITPQEVLEKCPRLAKNPRSQLLLSVWQRKPFWEEPYELLHVQRSWKLPSFSR